MNVFDLEAVLTLDTSEYDQGLSKAGEDAKRATGNAAAAQKNITTAALAGAGAMAAASTALVTKSIKSYAEYEQLVGGIETLYKSSANTVMQYANEAYKTAGMSANQYMETATSFAAALTQSLGGDTAKAAEYANTAITDMSDNANKMGTSIDSIVQTYQSLSRGNFAMLDNLKLGYGGTKAELERLLEDAERYKAAQGEIVDYSIDSYSDVVEAIHVVQQEMGITGTTAAESASTIEGSFNTAKAAAENFFTSLANPDADVSATFDSLVDSVATVAGNVLPVIGTIAANVWDLADSFPAVTGAVLPAAAAFGVFAVAINVVPAITAVKTAFMDFYAVLAANPIGLAIALMAGLAVATYNLVTHFSELYTEADKAAEGIRNLNRATESGVSGWVEQENAAKESMSGVQSSVESAASGVSDALGTAGADSGQAYRENLTNALSGIDADLAEQISAAMDGTASAVEGASTQIGEAGTSAVEQYASAFQSGEIGTAASNAVTQAVDAANGAASGFATVGQSIATEISTGVNASAGSISAAVSAMLTTAIVAGNVATGAAAAVGQNVGTQLAQGIHAGAGTVSSAIQNIVTTAITAGNAATSAAVNIGQNIGTQIASGASSGAGAVAGAVRGVVATAIAAGNAATGGASAIGANIARGIAAGISSGSGAIAAAARSAVQAAVAAAKAAAAISSPSKLFRDEVGYYMGLGVAAGLEDAEDEATKAAVKLARDTYSKAKEWIRRNAKMDRWSLQDELDAWIDVQAGFNEGSQQWLDAEETIFDIREKMADKHYSDEEKIINRDIKRNRRTIAEQIQLWTEMRDQYEKNSEEYLKIDDKIFDLRIDLQEEYEKKVEDFGKNAEKLWGNIAKAQENYNDKLESTVDKIAGVYGLFDDVQDREVISGEEITTNLQRQVNVLNSFYSGLDQLSARGVSGEMVEEIRGMGPKAVDQLEALLSMTDDQLSRYTDLYAEKQQIANEEALEELSGLKAETEAMIQENVNSLIDLYSENGPDIGEALTTGITDGIKRGMSDVIDAAIDLAESTVENIKARFVTGPVDAFKQMMGTSKVPFGSSGLGVASAGIINNAIAQADTKQEYTLNLTMADGSVMARWIFNPLKDYAAAKGQPIVNAT